MTLTLPPHPEGPLPLWYTWTCEVCRPRVVDYLTTQTARDALADDHFADFHPPHTVTRGTARARRK